MQMIPSAYNGLWSFTINAKKLLNLPRELLGTDGIVLSGLKIILKKGASALTDNKENKVDNME